MLFLLPLEDVMQQRKKYFYDIELKLIKLFYFVFPQF